MTTETRRFTDRLALGDRISDTVAAYAGLVGVGTTALTIALSVLLFEGYDWDVHDLSTLGHVSMESAAQSRLVFSGGLIVTALFGLVFAVGLSRIEDRLLWQVGAVLYAVSHLTVIWQAVFPAGVPQHNWLSIFPFFAGSLLVLGLDQIRVVETRLHGIVVLSNLVVGLLGAGLVLQTDVTGSAVLQTIGITVFALVTALYAARLLGVSGIATVSDGGGGERL
jgi:hypothetical membrane protein